MKLASSCVLVYMVASRIRSLIQAVSTAAGVTSPFLKEADSFVHALSGSDEVSQPTVGCWRVTGSLLKASFKNPAPRRDYDMATPSNTPYLSPSGDNGKGTRQYSTFSQPKRHDQLHLGLGHSVILRQTSCSQFVKKTKVVPRIGESASPSSPPGHGILDPRTGYVYAAADVAAATAAEPWNLAAAVGNEAYHTLVERIHSAPRWADNLLPSSAPSRAVLPRSRKLQVPVQQTGHI